MGGHQGLELLVRRARNARRLRPLPPHVVPPRPPVQVDECPAVSHPGTAVRPRQLHHPAVHVAGVLVALLLEGDLSHPVQGLEVGLRCASHGFHLPQLGPVRASGARAAVHSIPVQELQGLVVGLRAAAVAQSPTVARSHGVVCLDDHPRVQGAEGDCDAGLARVPIGSDGIAEDQAGDVGEEEIALVVGLLNLHDV